jgi:polar amino acid transport system substrate-binding protein
MNKLKSLLASAVVAAGFGTSASAEIKLGLDSSNYEPFYSRGADGEWTGWEIEIGDALCAAMKEECTWVPIAWDGIIPALTAKKIDAIVGSMSITDERKKTINFSDKYYNTPAALIAAKNMDITSAADLAGKNIGVQVSSTHENYVNANFADSSNVKIYQDFNEHNFDLVAGRVDAVVADSLALTPFLQSSDGSAFEVKMILNDDAIFGIGVGAGIRKEDTDLVAKFNAAIAQIRADGTYDTISAKYFDFDIYGGSN